MCEEWAPQTSTHLSQKLHSQKKPKKNHQKNTIRRKERQQSAQFEFTCIQIDVGNDGSSRCIWFLHMLTIFKKTYFKTVTSACKDLDNKLTNFFSQMVFQKLQVPSAHLTKEWRECRRGEGHRNRKKQKPFLSFKEKNIKFFAAFVG